MRCRGAILSAAVVLTACSSNPPPPPASDAEQTAALYAEFNCLVHAAAATDDQKSDASTIALAVEGQCEREFQASFEVYARGGNSAEQRMLYHKMEEGRLQTATMAVLKERSLRGGR